MSLYRVTAAYTTVGVRVASPDAIRVTTAYNITAIQTPAAIRATGVYITVSRSVLGFDNPPPAADQRLMAWDSTGIRRPYRWRSKLFLNAIPVSYSVAQVRAADYSNLTLRIYAQGVLLHERVVTSDKEFTIPIVEHTRTEIEIEGTSTVQTVQIAERVEELT